MITPEEFLKLIKDDPSANYKIGTVGTVNGNKAKIIFDGEQVQSGKEYLGVGYTPSINDRVLLINVSGTYLILGKIGGAGSSGGGLSINIDGGYPSTIYGGLDSIDGGGVVGS